MITQNNETEFLASLIIHGNTPHHHATFFCEKITEDDFQNNQNKKIFSAIKKIVMDRGNINLITILDSIGKDMALARELTEISSSFVGNFPAESAEMLLKDSINRELKKIKSYEDFGMVDTLRSRLQEIKREEKTMKAEDHVVQAIVQRDLVKGVPTGFKKIDKITKMLCPGHFWIVGGYSNTGKTQFAVQMLNTVHKIAKCLFISLEMTSPDIADKILRRKVYEYRLNPKNEDFSDKDLDNAGIRDIEKNPFLISDHIFSILEIQRLIEEESPSVVFIDYAQIISVREGNEYERMTAISRNMKIIAKKTNTCIVLLSQVSEDFQKGKSNATAGFKGSGSLVADCDVGIILRRYFDDEGGNNIVPFNVFIRKNRYGQTGKIEMKFDKSDGQILE